MTTPSLRELFDRVLTNFRTTLHTSFPGQVLAYDAEKQTVDVRPAIQREVPTDDARAPWELQSLPDLYGVQVMWQRAGDFAVTFPIKPGDWVLVVCAEQSTMLWRSRAGAPSPPGVLDPHGLNGLVALPGWFPDKEKLSGVSTTDVVIGKVDGSASIKLKPDGTIVLGGEQGAQLIALANKVDALFKALVSAVPSPSPDSGAAIQTAVKTAWNAVGNSVAATKVRAT